MNKKRDKKEIIARMNEIGVQKRVCLGSCPMKREATPAVIDEENRTIDFVMISKENAGERYDWWDDEIYIEELDVNGARFDRLRAMFIDHHVIVENAIAKLTNNRIEGGELKTSATFGSDEKSLTVFGKYRDEILTDVSIGYIVHDVVITEKKGEPDHVLVTDYEVVELSAVWRGFDSGATVGRSLEKTETSDERNDNQTPTSGGHCVDVLERELNLKTKGNLA